MCRLIAPRHVAPLRSAPRSGLVDLLVELVGGVAEADAEPLDGQAVNEGTAKQRLND